MFSTILFILILFIFGHAVASLCRTFERTFGIVMALYFVFMIFGGTMGVTPSQLPNGLRHFAMIFPTYWTATYLGEFWMGGGFAFWQLLVITAGMAAVACSLLMLSIYLTKRGKISQDARPQYYD